MLANVTTTHKSEIVTNQLKEQFLTGMVKEPSIYKLCRKLGIQRTLIYLDWMKDETFKARFDQVREGHIDAIEGNVFAKAIHDKAAFNQQRFILSSLRRGQYGNVVDNMNITNNTLIVAGDSDDLRTLAQSILCIEPKHGIDSDTSEANVVP